MQSANVSSRSIDHVVCTRCACFCDDLKVQVESGQVTGIENACQTGAEYFQDCAKRINVEAMVDSQLVTLDQAVSTAAGLIKEAKSPLIAGLEQADTETQQAICRFAMQNDFTVDPVVDRKITAVEAFQNTGDVSCTFGEIANRADLVVFWNSDPKTDQARHFERISLEPNGRFVPGGRSDRKCIVVHSAPNQSSCVADEVIEIKPGSELDALQLLRAMCLEDKIRLELAIHNTGQPLELWEQLYDQFVQAKYGVFFFGEADQVSPPTSLAIREAAASLTRELNHHTRFFEHWLANDENASGAESVMTWLLGSPYPVKCTTGNALGRFDEFATPNLVERGEVDLAIVFSSNALRQIELIQRDDNSVSIIYIGGTAVEHQSSSSLVSIPAKAYDIQCSGTVYRHDHVPLPLKTILKSETPSTVEILSKIQAKLN